MDEASSGADGGIFISYRRVDTAYATGWLYDRLARRFGAGTVFKDVDSIELGDDFVEVITAAGRLVRRPPGAHRQPVAARHR